MVGKDKTRVYVTFTKKQVEWLEKLSKKTGASVSKLVRFLVNKDMAKIVQILVMNEVKAKDLMEMVKIAQTPWLDDDEDQL